MVNRSYGRVTLELYELPDEQRRLVENELEQGESLLWLGKPKPWSFALGTLPIVLFGIPWTAFAVFWMFMASGGGMPDLRERTGWFALFGLPFVLIGLGMLLSPLFMVRKAKRTIYALTTSRAIIFSGGWSTDVRSFQLAALPELRRTQRRDGSGDVVFAQDVRRGSEGETHTTDVGFLAVPEVKAVETLVRDAAAAAGQTAEAVARPPQND